MDEAVICPNCGCPTASGKSNNLINNPDDEVNIGLCVLSALIPLFGLIYWGVKHKETPKKAKACGITALVAWGVSFLFSFVLMGDIIRYIF